MYVVVVVVVEDEEVRERKKIATKKRVPVMRGQRSILLRIRRINAQKQRQVSLAVPLRVYYARGSSFILGVFVFLRLRGYSLHVHDNDTHVSGRSPA